MRVHRRAGALSAADFAGIRRPPARCGCSVVRWGASVCRAVGAYAFEKKHDRPAPGNDSNSAPGGTLSACARCRPVWISAHALAALSYTGCRRAVYVIGISLGRRARPHVTRVGLSGLDGEQSCMLSASLLRRAGPCYQRRTASKAGCYQRRC